MGDDSYGSVALFIAHGCVSISLLVAVDGAVLLETLAKTQRPPTTLLLAGKKFQDELLQNAA